MKDVSFCTKIHTEAIHLCTYIKTGLSVQAKPCIPDQLSNHIGIAVCKNKKSSLCAHRKEPSAVGFTLYVIFVFPPEMIVK